MSARNAIKEKVLDRAGHFLGQVLKGRFKKKNKCPALLLEIGVFNTTKLRPDRPEYFILARICHQARI